LNTKSISTKILIQFAVLVTIVGVIVTTVGTKVAHQNMITQRQESLLEESELMANQIDEKLQDNLLSLESFARSPIFTDPTATVEDRSKFATEEAAAGIFHSLLYVQPNGDTLLTKIGVTINLYNTNDEAFMNCIETGESQYKPTRTLNNVTYMVTNAVPIFDENSTITGVLVGTIKISSFAELLGEDVEAFIIDPNGDFIGHTMAADFDEADGNNYWEEEGIKLATVPGDTRLNISVNPITYQEKDSYYAPLAALEQKMLASESGIIDDYTSITSGEEQYVAFCTVPSTGWKVAYLVNTSTIQGVVNKMIANQIILGVVVLLLGLVLTFFLSKSIVKPLKNASASLNKMIADIEDGNGDLTTRIPVKGKDECAQIITGINEYTEVLQNVTRKIKEGTSDLNSSMANVMSSITTSNDQATDTSAIMEELAASMQEVDNTTNNIKNYMDNVVESVNSIYDEASEGLSFSKEINNRAEELKNTSESSQKNTQAMIKSITETLQASIENSRNVEKINDLTNDILSIASQTNLLALNASIEAARAGEAGKGFAVVADEIRQLADNSKETAGSIQQVSDLVTDAVNELVLNANKLLDYMNKNVSEDYGRMVETGDAYVGDASQIGNIMASFQNKTDEIKAKITDALELLNGASRSISESAEGVTMAAQNTTELVKAISEIDSEMYNNREVTTELSDEIARFRNV